MEIAIISNSTRTILTWLNLLARSIANNSILRLRGTTLTAGCLGGYTGGNGSLSEVIAAETEVRADGEGGTMVKLCDVAFFSSRGKQ